MSGAACPAERGVGRLLPRVPTPVAARTYFLTADHSRCYQGRSTDRHNNSGHFVSTSFMELVIGLFVVGIVAAIAIRQFPEASLELSPRLNLVLGVVSGTVGVGLLDTPSGRTGTSPAALATGAVVATCASPQDEGSENGMDRVPR